MNVKHTVLREASFMVRYRCPNAPPDEPEFEYAYGLHVDIVFGSDGVKNARAIWICPRCGGSHSYLHAVESLEVTSFKRMLAQPRLDPWLAWELLSEDDRRHRAYRGVIRVAVQNWLDEELGREEPLDNPCILIPMISLPADVWLEEAPALSAAAVAEGVQLTCFSVIFPGNIAEIHIRADAALRSKAASLRGQSYDPLL